MAESNWTPKQIEFSARMIEQLLKISLVEARKMAAADAMLGALKNLKDRVPHPDCPGQEWSCKVDCDCASLYATPAIALATPEAR